MSRLLAVLLYTFVSLDPASSAAYSDVLTLAKISHGFLRYYTLCKPHVAGTTRASNLQVRRRTTAEIVTAQGEYLKPWLSHRDKEEKHNVDSKHRRLQLDWNIRACQCDGESWQCGIKDLKPGSRLSICLWTNSEQVEYVGVSEMTMSHENQVMVPVLNRVANEFTQVEQINRSSLVVHTTMLPEIDQESIPSNVIIEGKVYVTLKDSNDRSLLEPVKSEFFRVDVPLMRPSEYAPSLQESIYNTLKRTDFLVSIIVIFILWVALCCVLCGRRRSHPQDQKEKEQREVQHIEKAVKEIESSKV